MRLAFLNHEAAIASLPRTLEIHAQFLGWGPGKVEAERKAFLDYLSWNPDPLTTSESAEKRLASL
jgi:hypothetical protein